MPTALPLGPVRRDAALDAWVVTRFDHVAAALGDARLTIPGGSEATVRVGAARALPTALVRRWEDEWTRRARAHLNDLGDGCAVDLVADFAVPWSNVEAITIPTDAALYGPDIVGTWRLTPLNP